jgi:hypothetical protein
MDIMKNETITIRNKPNLKFLFNENNFEVVNDEESNQNGVYEYNLVDAVVLKKERINWFISTLDFIIFIFTSSSSSRIYKEKNLLYIKYKKKHLKIIIPKDSMNKAELISQKLKKKLN